VDRVSIGGASTDAGGGWASTSTEHVPATSDASMAEAHSSTPGPYRATAPTAVPDTLVSGRGKDRSSTSATSMARAGKKKNSLGIARFEF